MRHIKKAVENNLKKMRTSITGTITSVKKDGTIFAKISDDEELRDIKITSPYGLFSLPLTNSNGQVVFNNSSKKVSLVGVEHEPPVELNPGETVLYCSGGSYIHLKDGQIFINGPVIVNNGTQDVARVGDEVQVSVPEHGMCKGTITSGTPNIKA